MKCSKCHSDNPETSRFCAECGTQLPPSEKVSISPTETLQTPISELTRGSLFASRYEIIEKLGKGGMGKVYRVFDKKIDEEVALKLLKPEIAADKKIIERFKNELKFARKISHRNVCRMYDLSDEEGIFYITMEYVSGEDLKGMVKMMGQLSPGKSISIAKQVCEGLAEAHRLGVVHRDLKPQNIMIDKQGNARIMDFGIARSLEEKGITGAGVMMGTPEYMSPEQVEGEEADQRSDIYALGVILYEMLTGKVPFEGDTPLSIAMKQKSETPKDPRGINPQVSVDLARLIMKCLEKDKEKRYQKAENVLSELSKIEAGGVKEAKIEEVEWQNSIAVMPFADLSPQKDQEYFCDGMAEELINALTKIKDLRVVARTSAFSFKGKEIDIREIGKKLNVNTILEGSVRKAGNRLRIMAQLINVADGYHLWSEKYDRDIEDVFAIQDEISLAIVDKLKLKLLKEEKVDLLKRYTDNLEAYQLYLKGRYFWNKRFEVGLKKGLEFFQQAIERDKGYTLAYSGLADCYILLPWYGIFPQKEAYQKAKEAARKALEIDDKLAEAHTSMAFVKLLSDWDWAAAEKGFKQAIELNAKYSTAHHWYAFHLFFRARFDESIAEMEKALELDPFSLIINCDFGWALYYSRQYDRAIEVLKKTLDMDPNFVSAHSFLGRAYLQKSMYKEALTEFRKEKEPSKGWMQNVETVLGVAHMRMGKKKEAQNILEEMVERTKHEHVSPYHIALLSFNLGEDELGFEWLDRAYKEHEDWLLYLKVEPLFDSVRSDPRFTKLLKKIGFE
ncbi:MAG: protein kinase [Candidatus Aminicenantes bacterium]|nr:protein kinase [Candidatus Aminicenantes bacterium]